MSGLTSDALSHTTAITQLAQTIQLAIAPVFLLAGIGAFLNVCASRLARIIDRARVVEEQVFATTGAEHDRKVRDINQLDRRMRVINLSIGLSVASGIAVSSVVALLFLAELFRFKLGGAVAILFILTMLLVIASLSCFLFEIRLAARNIRIRSEVLNHEVEALND
jgi:uncharacterized membrane protein YciS (DUF1049 family)